jgi:hypothetical protein
MRCEECLPILEEYFDGELESRHAESISAHLAGCSRCGAAADALRIEQEAYSHYERDLDVTPGLWVGIAARIREERPVAASRQSGLRGWLGGLLRTPRLSPAFAVLLVMIAIAVTVIVTRQNGTNPEPQPQDLHARAGDNDTAKPPEAPAAVKVTTPVADHNDVVPVNAAGVGKPTKPPRPEQLIREAERKYEQAIAILSRDVNRRRPEMDAQVLARFDLALGAIDRTIAETRAAVRQQPGDPVALQYLLAAYSRKVDVLREMTAF